MRQSEEKKNPRHFSGDLTPHLWGLTKYHGALLTPSWHANQSLMHIMLQLPVSSSIQPCLHFSRLAVLWHALTVIFFYRLWNVLTSFLTYSTYYLLIRGFSHNCTIWSVDKFKNSRYKKGNVLKSQCVLLCAKDHGVILSTARLEAIAQCTFLCADEKHT